MSKKVMEGFVTGKVGFDEDGNASETELVEGGFRAGWAVACTYIADRLEDAGLDSYAAKCRGITNQAPTMKSLVLTKDEAEAAMEIAKRKDAEIVVKDADIRVFKYTKDD